MEKKATLLRDGNVFAVELDAKEAYPLLERALTFQALERLSPAAAKALGRPVRTVQEQMFSYDHRKRFNTFLGFIEVVLRVLKAEGYVPTVRRLTPPPRPLAYVPVWENLDGIGFRYRQMECLEKIVKSPHGLIDAWPGFGKSHLLAVLCRLYPQAKIGVVTRSVAVLLDRIYPDIARMVPSVDVITSQKKVRNKGRVILCSSGSMDHLPDDLDFFFLDEVHEAAADGESSKLVRFGHAKMFGFSGSLNSRSDEKDHRITAVFGPTIFKLGSKEAVENGLVVPTEVRMRTVRMARDPVGTTTHPVFKKKRGIWNNDVRNRMIAEDARRYPDAQVLIPCETIEHVLNLKKFLPEFEIVHAADAFKGKKMADFEAFKRQGLIPDDYRQMTQTRKAWLTKMFTHGKLRKVLVTTVWNRGVSFEGLSVLIRADGGNSTISDTQIPCRANRIKEGKELAIVHDYRDEFNPGFERKSLDRIRNYKKFSWNVVDFDRGPGLFDTAFDSNGEEADP